MTTLTTVTPSMGGGGMAGRVPRPAAPVGLGLTGADALRIFRQRLLLIMVLWILFTACTVVFTYYMKFYHPEYTAFALIRVDSISPPDVTEPFKKIDTSQQEIEREVQNQALIIKGPSLMESALKDPELQATEWYRWAVDEAKRKNDSVTDLLSDAVIATAVRDSNLLRVGATWKNPDEVKTIVNKIVERYVFEINTQQKTAIRASEEQLATELERAKQTFEGQKRDIEEFRQTADFTTMGREETSESVLTLTALVTELQAETNGFKTQYDTLNNAKPEDLPITAELQAILQQDSIIMQLDQRAQNAEENYSAARARFGDNHRTVQEAKRIRDAAQDKAGSERATKILQYQARQITQARRNYLESQDQLVALKQQLYEAQSEQKDRDAKRMRYESMQQDLDLLRLQYENLLEKKNSMGMVLRQRRMVQIEPQSMAVKPMRMSSPQPSIWIPGGCFFGFALSLGIAFLLELSDKSVRTPRDLARAHVPVLGTIPSTEDDEIEIERVETACLDAPHSIVAEAFRGLRANLFFSAPAEQQGVIMVTSPSAGNGKTTVSTNLAISIALSGRRVLLIDANFRRPSLPRIFPNMKQEGLSNILIGQKRLEELVTETNVPGLHVLSSGPTPPNPAELLGSSFLRDIIVDARSMYDQVIFDGPPILLVSDAMVLAGAVDGCLMVCQYRVTSRGALQRSHSNLEAIGARVFGAVLNRVQTRAGGYFRRAYREFYDYHEVDEDAGGERPKLEVTQAAAAVPPPADDSSGPDAGARVGELPRPAATQTSTTVASSTKPTAISPAADSIFNEADALHDEIMNLEEIGDLGLLGESPDTGELHSPNRTEIADDAAFADDEIKFVEDDLKDLEIHDDFDLGEDLGDLFDDDADKGPDKPRGR